MRIEKKNLILNPISIFFGTWGVIFLVDYVYPFFSDEPFYPLSLSLAVFTVIALLLWSAGFVCASFIPPVFYFVKKPLSWQFCSTFRKASRWYIGLMSFALALVLLDHYILVGPDFLLPNGIIQYRVAVTMEGLSATFPWLSLFNYFFFFFPAFALSWYFSGEQLSRASVCAGLFLFCLFVYFSTARSSVFFPLLLTFFVALHYRFKIRYFLYLFVTLFVLFGAMGALVGKSGFTRIFFYMLSPIHAFDLLYDEQVSYEPGFLSFRIFHPILVKLGVIDTAMVSLDNIYTPMPTNVFTVFGVYFLDYGKCGLYIFIFISSFLSAICYYLSLFRNSPRTIVFSAMSYVLICLGVFYDYYTSTFFVFFAWFYVQFFFPRRAVQRDFQG